MKVVSNAYLSPRKEWINLLFPLISIPFIIAEFKLGLAFSMSFFVALSHFGAIHHLVTIFIVGQSPECILWAKDHFGTLNKFFISLFALGIILFITFILSMQELESRHPFMQWVFLGFILFDIYVLSAFHMIQQSKGLSLLYNKFGEASKNVKTWEKWERLCAIGLLIGVILAGFFGTYRKNPIAISSYISRPLEIFGLTLAIFSAITYVYASIRSTIHLKSSKGIFSLRMLVWVFYPFSMVAQATIRLVHGIEYYFVYAKIENSRKSMITIIGIASALFLISVYGFILSFRNDGLAVYLGEIGWAQKGIINEYLGGIKIRHLAYSFYGTLNVLHILIDSFIFRYKFPQARLATLQHLMKINK